MSPAPAVELEGLRLELGGRTVVEVPSLAISAGEVLGLLGPNGAGKSSLLSLVGLLRRPTSGEVRHCGERVDTLTGRALLRARRRLACVFQDPLLLDRSVGFNVELGLRLRGVPASERREGARRSLALLGIEGLAGRRAATLSGGEAQRASIARALAVGPELLLLDEPFGGLDEATRRSLVADAGELLGGGGRSALLVTHDRSEALALCDRVAVMMDGRLVQVGRAAEVVARPADRAVAAFLGYDNSFGAEVVGRPRPDRLVVRLASGLELRATAAGPAGEAPGSVVVMVRSEDVLVGGPAGPDATRLEGVVRRVVPEGFACRLTLEVGVRLRAVATSRQVAGLGLAVGAAVEVVLPADSVLAFW